jgi:GNAT superfamily N-acetyltransferase
VDAGLCFRRNTDEKGMNADGGNCFAIRPSVFIRGYPCSSSSSLAASETCFELESGARALHLIDLFVALEARRQGVARALFVELACIALELGCELRA